MVPLNQKLLECKAHVEFASVSAVTCSMRLAHGTRALDVC